MKHLKLIFALILLVFVLASCEKAPIEPPEPETTEVPAKDITFVGGENSYVLVRPGEATDGEAKALSTLFSKIMKKTGQQLPLSSDRIDPGEEVPEYEILVGNVDREEANDAQSLLPFFGYVIKVVNEKLVILGANDDYIVEAAEYIVENLLTNDGIVLKENYLYIHDSNEGNYLLKDATIDGRSLSEYAITSESEELALRLQKIIGEASSHRLPIVDADSDLPLLIAGKAHPDDKNELSYYSARIDVKDDDIYLYGYDDYAVSHTFIVLRDKLASKPALSLADVKYTYDLPNREAYIEDPSLLYMRWEYDWTASEWMLDYEQKKKDLFGGNGSKKLYASAHRAEWKYYPENSIEAIISAYYMGCSIVELDFGVTKDGVIVLMHDNTLTRTTNASQYIARPGLPNSTKVSDWTYEQLMLLNLKEGGGGDNAAITPFKIPTLEEALKVCKDRLFIVPDKAENWQYVKSTGIMQASRQIYLTDVMKKTGNFESIIISYGKSSANYLTAVEAVELQKLIKAEIGVAPMICVRCTPDAASSYYNTLASSAEPGTYALQINGDYKASTNYAAVHKSYGDKISLLAWTIGTSNDNETSWTDMYSKGVRMIMTNDLLPFLKIAKKFAGDK